MTIALPVGMLALIGWWLAQSHGPRLLLAEALARLRPGPVLVVLPVQGFAIFICAVALYTLRPGVSLRAAFASRLVRDAGNNMLLILPGLGEAIGARVLVLAGARPRTAVSVRALDIMAETLGQLPYMVVAVVVLSRVWRRIGLPALAGWGRGRAPGVGAVLAGLAISVALVWWWARGPGRRVRFVQRLRRARLVRRLRTEASLLGREIRRRRGALPLAILLHIAAWGLSGVQIWLAAKAFGLPLGFGGAIAIESAASAVKVVLFFVPGALVMQEAGIVGAGLAFGLAPDASLALALVLRVRDVCFGLALAGWPWLEWRARQR